MSQLAFSREYLLADRIGSNGLSKAQLEAGFAKADDILNSLQTHYRKSTLPLLSLPEKTDDLQDIETYAAKIRAQFDDVIILGTGGSSLGGQTLCQLSGYGVTQLPMSETIPRLHFFDNLDARQMEMLARDAVAGNSFFLIISKSGGTLETLAQTSIIIDAFWEAGFKQEIQNRFLAISEPVNGPTPNPLRSYLEPYNVPFLEHPTDIGGRYSVFCNVGLLPAAIAGLDIAKIRQGAGVALDDLLEAKTAQNSEIMHSVVETVTFMRSGIASHVMMAYSSYLERFTKWLVQLQAESLGKQNQGITPIDALAPVDQHSQLQLFMDGPQDKLVTILRHEEPMGPRLSNDLARHLRHEQLGDKQVSDIVCAQARGTAAALAERGVPVREIKLHKLDETVLGELLMFCMLETIALGYFMEINPFNQPAVENAKQRALSLM